MTTWNGSIHPAAEHSPMLPEDALDRLAADIAAHGLRDPLTITPDGALLDGRNRAEACKRAKTEPAFEIYEGDPWAFVMSKNLQRRHVSTGSRAATVALMLAEQGKRKNGRWQRGSVPDNGDSVESHNTWAWHMTRAGVVLDWVPDSLRHVVDETASLDAAFQLADKKRQADMLMREQERKRREQEMAAADGVLSDYLTHVSHILQLDLGKALEAQELGGWESIAKHAGTIIQIFETLKEQADERLG